MLRAFTHAAQELPTGGTVSEVIVTLNTVGQLTYPHNEQLTERLDTLAETLRDSARDQVDEGLVKLCNEVAAFCHLSAATVEIFDQDLDETILQRLCSGPYGVLETVARARRDLAVEPLLSWAFITEVRQKVMELSTARPPHPNDSADLGSL